MFFYANGDLLEMNYIEAKSFENCAFCGEETLKIAIDFERPFCGDECYGAYFYDLYQIS